MSLDFRAENTFPRRGREPLGGVLWLARMFDKARAKANHTQDGYIYPCPMDRSMMERWGITPDEFTTAVNDHHSDDQILAWLESRSTAQQREAANAWLLQHKKDNLDRQDADEKVPGAIAPGPWRDIIFGGVVAILTLGLAWLILRPHHP